MANEGPDVEGLAKGVPVPNKTSCVPVFFSCAMRKVVDSKKIRR